jgi:hypothetical protein
MSKKTMTIATFLVVIALATMGLAYGAWTETLTIDGTVGTGRLDVDFVGTDGPVADADPLNVATCSLDYEEDSVTVTIGNAYPGYQCNPMIRLQNTGTIPADVRVNLPPTFPAEGVGVGGIMIAQYPFGPGAVTAFTLPVEVYDTPPMGGSFQFTFDIPVAQPAP